MDGMSNDVRGGGSIFINTFKEFFTRKITQDEYEERKIAEDPHVATRKNKHDVQVYEERHRAVIGFLYGIEKYYNADNRGFENQWHVKICTDKGTKYLISLPYTGGSTMGLLHRLPSIDLMRPVKLALYHFEEDNKTQLTVEQQVEGKWEKLPKFWTKEDPKDLPPLEKTTLNGQDVWDSTKQMIYLEKLVAHPQMVARFQEVKNMIEGAEYANRNTEMPEDFTIQDGDIPGDDQIVTETSTQTDSNIGPDESDDLPF